MEYQGITTCAAAAALHGGTKNCSYGCIGFGDCVNVCEYDAIAVEDNVARINPAKCKSCGMCVKTCPKHLISIVPLKSRLWLCAATATREPLQLRHAEQPA